MKHDDWQNGSLRPAIRDVQVGALNFVCLARGHHRSIIHQFRVVASCCARRASHLKTTNTNLQTAKHRFETRNSPASRSCILVSTSRAAGDMHIATGMQQLNNSSSIARSGSRLIDGFQQPNSQMMLQDTPSLYSFCSITLCCT